MILNNSINYNSLGISDQGFKIDDIVWAKVKGYSWWPAKVSSYLFFNFAI